MSADFSTGPHGRTGDAVPPPVDNPVDPVDNSPAGRLPAGVEPVAADEPVAEAGESAESAEEAQAGIGRAALDVARAASRRAPIKPGRRVAGRRSEARRGGYSGPGPDQRDPQPFGSLVRGLVADRGWETTAASATVLSSWDRIVGPELASRCQPVSLRAGELTLAAESTAWAMQLRSMLPTLMTRIRGELGPAVVTRIRIHGPTAPSWNNGPRRVAGRGPRDTYG